MIIKRRNVTNLRTDHPSKKPQAFDVFILTFKNKPKAKEMEMCSFVLPIGIFSKND